MVFKFAWYQSTVRFSPHTKHNGIGVIASPVKVYPNETTLAVLPRAHRLCLLSSTHTRAFIWVPILSRAQFGVTIFPLQKLLFYYHRTITNCRIHASLIRLSLCTMKFASCCYLIKRYGGVFSMIMLPVTTTAETLIAY